VWPYDRPVAGHVGDPAGVSAHVDAVLDEVGSVLDEVGRRWAKAAHRSDLPDDAGYDDVLMLLRAVVTSGGKRVRPLLCRWGYLAAGGPNRAPAAQADVVRASAALELLHSFAVVHDDVMDESPLRRGSASVHERVRRRHLEDGLVGDAGRFGESVAILVGDLAHSCAWELASSLPEPARAVWRELEMELVLGQHLDLDRTAHERRDERSATAVARLKTGAYTVERPLLLGVAVAGAADELAPVVTAFGTPLGTAFQLRDDLLGVFGTTETTGKPVGDDLRQGKLTVLLALTEQRARRTADAALVNRIGCPDLSEAEIDDLRALIVDCGARAAAEQRIADLVDEACGALEDPRVDAAARSGLAALARSLAWREA